MIALLAGRFSLLKVLRTRSYALLWLGQVISFLGDNMYRIALAWEVLLLTGSATSMGIVLAANLVPTLIFLLLGGVTADRLPRRLILLTSDGGRAILVGIIALLGLLHQLQFWHLVVFSLIFGVVDSFFSPAYQSIQPQLVERDMLQSANALTQLGGLLSNLLGPALGAICVAAFGASSAFAFDALSFVISFACVLAIHMPSVVAQTEEEPTAQSGGVQSMLADIREGIRYVTGSTWLWLTITIASLANITYFGPIAVAMPRLVHDSYGVGVWLLGAITTMDAVGGIVATLLTSQMRLKRRRGLLAYSALLISSITLIAFGLPLPHTLAPTIAIIASIFTGFGLGVFQVVWVTIMQEQVPADALGRVSSIDMLGSMILLPIGFALIGILTDHFGPAPMFVFGGLLTLLLVSIGLSVRDIRMLN